MRLWKADATLRQRFTEDVTRIDVPLEAAGESFRFRDRGGMDRPK